MLLAVLLLLLLVLYIAYCHNAFSYWDNRKVPSYKPITPLGNVWKSFLCLNNLGDSLHTYYESFKNNDHKYGGIYFGLGPVFVPVDSELIKRILVNDFEYFGTRTVYNKYFPFNENLHNMAYSEWKQLRTKFSGQFFPEKLKILHNVAYTSSKEMLDIISQHKSESINMTVLAQKYVMDVIQEWFIGSKEDNLHKTDTDIQKILPHLQSCTYKNLFLTIYREGVKNAAIFTKAIATSPAVIKYFTKLTINESKQYKSKGSHSNAFMNNLITVIYNKCRHHINYVEIASYLCSFYCHTLNAMPFNLTMTLYCLGNDQYLQDNVRNEVLCELNKNKKMKCKSIASMKLLEATVLECFRMFPVDMALQRTCIKKYNIPGTEVTLNKGTRVLIPIAGYNFDPTVYPNPNTFTPYRYMENDLNKQLHLHFGAGPRQCLGTDFGLLIIKTALALILKEYRVVVDVVKTGKRIKMENVTKNFMFQYKNKVWLNFERL